MPGQEVHMREALRQAGVSEAQVEGVVQNLELQNLVLVPAQATPVAEANAVATPDGRTWLSLEIRALEPRQEQLEALERAASLSRGA